MRKALVTLTIGQAYEENWKRFCERSWRSYAEKHGYDVCVVTEALDTTPASKQRSVNWQKLLLAKSPRLAHYDRLVWLDSDIIINSPEAPCVVQAVPEEKIGLSLYGDLQVPEELPLHRHRWASAFHQKQPELPYEHLKKAFDFYYQTYGQKKISDLRFNTGVLVFSPRLHGDFFGQVYATHTKDAFDQEQTPLNYEILKHQLQHVMDRRFNIHLGDELLRDYPFLFLFDGEESDFLKNEEFRAVCAMAFLNIHQKSFFTHLCGCRWPFPIFEQALKQDLDYRRIARKLWAE